jgi:hypothetical protein
MTKLESRSRIEFNLLNEFDPAVEDCWSIGFSIPVMSLFKGLVIQDTPAIPLVIIQIVLADAHCLLPFCGTMI